MCRPGWLLGHTSNSLDARKMREREKLTHSDREKKIKQSKVFRRRAAKPGDQAPQNRSTERDEGLRWARVQGFTISWLLFLPNPRLRSKDGFIFFFSDGRWLWKLRMMAE